MSESVGCSFDRPELERLRRENAAYRKVVEAAQRFLDTEMSLEANMLALALDELGDLHPWHE